MEKQRLISIRLLAASTVIVACTSAEPFQLRGDSGVTPSLTGDATGFYANPVERSDRSRMNVPFTLADASLDDAFLKGAQQRGMLQLKGHRSVGGMRASIYNAMPIEGVSALVAYMKEFEASHG